MEATQTETSSMMISTVVELTKKLERLYRAKEAHDENAVRKIDEEILGMVPLGYYEGYLSDDATNRTVSHLEVLAVKRRNDGADFDRFFVVVQELGGNDGIEHVGDTRHIDLNEFFRNVCRPIKGSLGSHHGPRFWLLHRHH